jgi:5-oxoprolinase (ATP-hydrolysing) subunit A
MALEWRPFGDAALWAPRPIGNDDDAEVEPLSLLSALRTCEGVVDVVVKEERVSVYFDPAFPPRGLERTLEGACERRAKGAPREHVIRARYDGVDLGEVAERSGLSTEEVISTHSAGVYVVRMMGFLPGFAYLGGLDERLVAPRRSVPRPRVAAGSVAIASSYTGVYPFDSPGGWNVIARAVDAALFRGDTGALLRLGDRVRFERVG